MVHFTTSQHVNSFPSPQCAYEYYFRLDCTEECRVIERNRRLAIGLQIRNPDLSAKLTPRYSEFMRQWAKKDPHFCNMVHDKLTELVQLAKQVVLHLSIIKILLSPHFLLSSLPDSFYETIYSILHKTIHLLLTCHITMQNHGGR